MSLPDVYFDRFARVCRELAADATASIPDDRRNEAKLNLLIVRAQAAAETAECLARSIRLNRRSA